jgi:hypothetical protein
MKTPIAGLDDFAALDPFFRIIERGLDGLAGERAEASSYGPAAGSSYSEVANTSMRRG